MAEPSRALRLGRCGFGRAGCGVLLGQLGISQGEVGIWPGHVGVLARACRDLAGPGMGCSRAGWETSLGQVRISRGSGCVPGVHPQNLAGQAVLHPSAVAPQRLKRQGR